LINFATIHQSTTMFSENEYNDSEMYGYRADLFMALRIEDSHEYPQLVQNACTYSFDVLDGMTAELFRINTFTPPAVVRLTQNVWQSFGDWRVQTGGDCICSAIQYFFVDVDHLSDAERVNRDLFWTHLRSRYVTADAYITRLARFLYLDPVDSRIQVIRESSVWLRLDTDSVRSLSADI